MFMRFGNELKIEFGKIELSLRLDRDDLWSD